MERTIHNVVASNNTAKYDALLKKLDDANNGIETIGMKLYRMPEYKRFPKIKKLLTKREINPFSTFKGILIWKHFQKYAIEAYKESLYE